MPNVFLRGEINIGDPGYHLGPEDLLVLKSVLENIDTYVSDDDRFEMLEESAKNGQPNLADKMKATHHKITMQLRGL